MAALAYVEGELQQLVGAIDVLGVDDARDTEVDLRKIIDRNLRGARRSSVPGRGRRLG